LEKRLGEASSKPDREKERDNHPLEIININYLIHPIASIVKAAVFFSLVCRGFGRDLADSLMKALDNL
jgi:hypothetical protein